ncbi:alpha/beta fold hydrolase [Flagellimonas nanhaiensis]|uniref:PDZ domain-containing protein n=1 Tax=Flagellimonas nanhaiensis TaxID=2292706 RepID=A0A371JLC5_9FLAO|nr:alpha/beta fold hydrolase [Allomuricauda nanhaiensis]RDY57738.1 PDZ domain-containing protein [Allomuricauda nanhaiensis]
MRHLLLIRLLVIISIVGCTKSSKAQELKRKASLGIMMQPLTDSLATELKLEPGAGLYISEVVTGSTANNLGMKSGAVLQKINGKQMSSNRDVFEILADFRAEDDITLEYILDGTRVSKTGKGIARPKESYENAEVTYGTVSYEGNMLRSILYTPRNRSNTPVVYFLQGYTCGSIDLSFAPDHPYMKLIRSWVDAGFSVYRLEKPGVGESESQKNCFEINFNEELQAFQEGYKDLMAMEEIDTDNIFLFGHSMGGVIAPLLGEIKQPKGIMAYGTVGKKWYDYMVDLYTIQPKHFGISEAEIKENNKINLKFNDDMLVHKLSGAELAKKESYGQLFDLNELKTEQYIGRHITFWQGLADIDIPEVWTRTRTNVFIMHGEFDIQAINEEGPKRIVDLVNKNGSNAKFKVIENADHGFINFTSMQQNSETLGNGSYSSHARDNFNLEIGRESIKWMQGLLNG